MEVKEGLNDSGVGVKGDEAPQNYRVGSADHPALHPGAGSFPSEEVRKKRGRPRKYAGDGSVVALSPMPISASIPFTGDYPPAWKPNPVVRPVPNPEFESPDVLGRTVASPPVIGGFTPHMITVNTGEDITMKVISFSQEVSRSICILAANGTISNVTLRQPNSSGGTLTHEGHFEIISLTGSFMPSDNGKTKNRSGGMSVSLAGPDGRVLGGGLAGMLVAAGPVQIVIGSFDSAQHEQQHQEQMPTKKPKYDPMPTKKPEYEQTISFAPIEAIPISEQRHEAPYNGPKPTSFREDKWASVNSVHGLKNTGSHENNAAEDSRGQSHEMTR